MGIPLARALQDMQVGSGLSPRLGARSQSKQRSEGQPQSCPNSPPQCQGEAWAPALPPLPRLSSWEPLLVFYLLQANIYWEGVPSEAICEVLGNLICIERLGWWDCTPR